jgi:hypothetical protein
MRSAYLLRYFIFFSDLPRQVILDFSALYELILALIYAFLAAI